MVGKRTVINPPGMAEAVGPFVRAIRIDNHLYIAGTSALSHISGDFYARELPTGVEEQTRLTLENIKSCVEAVGATMDDIFKIVIMLKNPADYRAMNAVRAAYFQKSPPVSTCFQADLLRQDMLVEIEAIALLP